MSIRQAVARLKNRPVIQETKSRAAVRTIALPVEAVAALKGHKARQNAERLAIGDAWADHDLVFPTPAGGPIHASNVARNFYLIVARADVPRIRFHDLRHTHATWLIADGQPITTVSERLGHAKPSITTDIYGHVVAATRDGAALAMSALSFGGSEKTGAKTGS